MKTVTYPRPTWLALALLLVAGPTLVTAQSATPAPAAAVPAGALHQGAPGALATVLIFSDFECPVCARVPSVIKELTSTYPGAIRIVFKHNPLPMHANAPLAHEAALAAAAQGKFWEMHDRLFANQQRLALDDLVAHAAAIGLDVVRFRAALEDRRFKPVVDQDVTEAQALGVTSTPTIFVNGSRYNGLPAFPALRAQVEVAMGLTPATTTVPVELRPGDVNLDGAPALGPENAPVTIIEYSDLECPFCRTVLPTVRQVLKAYPDQVRWVFKHFPLDIHPDAPLAHEAALAANVQGKFWEFHDLVFANQAQMEREHLIAHARTLNLDLERFTSDLDSRRFKAVVDAVKNEGRGIGVSGTPTFFINGRRLEGNKSLAEFRGLIDTALREGGKLTTAAAPAEEGVRATVGPSTAPVEMLWYSDLRSPLTPKAYALVKSLLAKYPDHLRVVVRHRPVDVRPDGRLAHEGALAAGAQGKFWEMHDLITAQGRTVTRELLQAFASRLGLDAARFAADLDGGTHKAVIVRDIADAQRREVRGTPVFFVRGQRIDGLQPLAMFERVIDAEIAKAKSGANP